MLEKGEVMADPMETQPEIRSKGNIGCILEIAARLDQQRATGELPSLNAAYAAFTGLVRIVHDGEQPGIQVIEPATSQQ